MENKPIAGSHLTDTQVASAVRMLLRDQLNHEAVCLVARDRIVSLATERDQLKARLEAAEREQQRVHELANRLLDANNGLIDTIRKLDLDALCDWHDSIGGDEYLQRWLAVRDAARGEK